MIMDSNNIKRRGGDFDADLPVKNGVIYRRISTNCLPFSVSS